MKAVEIIPNDLREAIDNAIFRNMKEVIIDSNEKYKIITDFEDLDSTNFINGNSIYMVTDNTQVELHNVLGKYSICNIIFNCKLQITKMPNAVASFKNCVFLKDIDISDTEINWIQFDNCMIEHLSIKNTNFKNHVYIINSIVNRGVGIIQSNVDTVLVQGSDLDSFQTYNSNIKKLALEKLKLNDLFITHIPQDTDEMQFSEIEASLCCISIKNVFGCMLGVIRSNFKRIDEFEISFSNPCKYQYTIDTLEFLKDGFAKAENIDKVIYIDKLLSQQRLKNTKNSFYKFIWITTKNFNSLSRLLIWILIIILIFSVVYFATGNCNIQHFIEAKKALNESGILYVVYKAFHSFYNSFLLSLSAFTTFSADPAISFKNDIIKIISYVETFFGIVSGILFAAVIAKRANFFDKKQ